MCLLQDETEEKLKQQRMRQLRHQQKLVRWNRRKLTPTSLTFSCLNDDERHVSERCRPHGRRCLSKLNFFGTRNQNGCWCNTVFHPSVPSHPRVDLSFVYLTNSSHLLPTNVCVKMKPWRWISLRSASPCVFVADGECLLTVLHSVLTSTVCPTSSRTSATHTAGKVSHLRCWSLSRTRVWLEISVKCLCPQFGL